MQLAAKDSKLTLNAVHIAVLSGWLKESTAS